MMLLGSRALICVVVMLLLLLVAVVILGVSSILGIESTILELVLVGVGSVGILSGIIAIIFEWFEY